MCYPRCGDAGIVNLPRGTSSCEQRGTSLKASRLAALHTVVETGPWPKKQKNETDISGVSKPWPGASRARRQGGKSAKQYAFTIRGKRWPRWRHVFLYCTVC